MSLEKMESNHKNSQDEAESLFLKLPSDLQNRWRESFDELDGDAALSFIKDILKKRSNVTSFSGEKSINPTETDAAKIFLNAITSAKYDVSNFLGKGMVGYVYVLPENPSLCIKYMRPKSERPADHISPIKEYKTAEEVRRLTERCEAKSPEMFSYIDQEGRQMYVMERVYGQTLNEIIKNRNIKSSDLPIPEKFEKVLYEYFKILHSNGIAHYDFHGGNVMLDTKNKTVAIIDFSRAVRSEGIGEDALFERAKQQDLLDIKNHVERYTNYYKSLTQEIK